MSRKVILLQDIPKAQREVPLREDVSKNKKFKENPPCAGGAQQEEGQFPLWLSHTNAKEEGHSSGSRAGDPLQASAESLIQLKHCI